MFTSKSDRRTFLRNAMRTASAAALSGAALPLAGCARKTTDDPSIPNIILITADDLGWKDLSCYGNREINTPNIDRIAREGAMCTRAFVVSSSCAPSRASFMTGQYPHTNGVTGLTHIHRSRLLMPFYQTLQGMLSRAGYNTALQGKWHPSPYLPASWYGYRERLSGVLPKDWKIDNGKRADEFIRQNQGNRFFMEINFMHNHRDNRGEFSFDPEFPVDPEDVHVPDYWTLPDWPEIRLETAKFYSQTMKMDSIIGEILDTLDDTGLAENTLVMFVSDNGPPFPGNKMTLYDRGTGTPLIARWPGKIRPGTVITGMINTIDIMPTLAEAAGLKVPGDVQGRSFMPYLTGAKKGPFRNAVFMEMTDHVHYLPTRAARTERWKYIRNYSDIAKGLDQCNHMEWAHRVCELPNQPWKKPRVREELYDLSRDPDEQQNLAGNPRYAKRLKKMRELLDSHMKQTGDPFLGKTFTRDYNPEMYKPSTQGAKYK